MRKALTVAIIAVMLFGSLALLPAPARAETISNEKIGTIVLTDYEFNEYPNSAIDNWKIDLTNIYTSYTYTNVTEYINESGFVVELGTNAKGFYFFPVAQDYDAFIEFNVSYSGSSSGQMTIFLEHYAGLGSRKYNPAITLLKTRINPADGWDSTYYPITYPATIKIYLGYFNHTYKLWVNNQLIYENTTAFATEYPFLGPPISHIDAAVFGSDGTFILRYLKVYKPRYTITPMPIKFIAPGFDARFDEHQWDQTILLNLTMQYGGRGTIFYEVGKNATTTLKYLNKGWELGIHFIGELTELTESEAEAMIDNEYSNITALFPGYTPHFFTAQGNKVNSTHANYAWQKYHLIDRTKAFKGDYATWECLNDRYEQIIRAINAGANVYFYTHNASATDPTAVTAENYTKVLQAAKQNGYLILPWYEAYMITRNTHEFYATNIQKGDGYFKFTAHTNGYKAYVDVAYTPTANTIVKDLTTGKIINWQKGSVQFWVEDGHTYEIIDTMKQAINISIDWTYAIVNAMIPIAIFAVLLSALTQILQAVRKSVRFRK